MEEQKSIILRSSVTDFIPTVNQLETTLLGLGYNRADAKLYGLKVSGGTKIVVQIGGSGGGDPYTHPTYTPVDAALTGATVLSTFKSNEIGSVTEFTTRTLTLAELGYTAPDQYWTRDALSNLLIPVNIGDGVAIYSQNNLNLTLIAWSQINIFHELEYPGTFSSFLNDDVTSYDTLRLDTAGGSYPEGPKVEGIRLVYTGGVTNWSSTNYGSRFSIETCAMNETDLIGRFRIDEYGKVKIGDINGYEYLEVNSFLDSSYNRLVLNGRNKVPSWDFLRDSSSTYLAANTSLGSINFAGKGYSLNPSAQIYVTSGSSSWSSTNSGVLLNLRTAALGSNVLTSRLLVSEDGDVIINDSSLAMGFYVRGDNDSGLFNIYDDKVGIGTGSTISTKFHIKASSSWGQSLVKIEQADDDKAFIEFTGTSSSDQTKSISTTPGAGAVVGPKYKTDAADGWQFNCMIRQTVNGNDVWFAGYTPIAAS